jgi:predicted DCC family thiol-disulfide oxidoreductase YuxK
VSVPGVAVRPTPLCDAALLYDGECGFCSATVRFVLRHERRHTLLFAPLQGPFGAEVLARHPGLRGLDSVVWLEPAHGATPERAYVRSDAVLRVAAYLGRTWRLCLAARICPRPWRDAVYDFVARRRHRIPRRSGSCPLPDASTRDRFLP